MIVLQMAQLIPSDHYPIRRQLQVPRVPAARVCGLAGAEGAWSLAQVLSNQCIVDDDVPCNTLSYWEHQ
jgi:hypothetical protein